MKKILLAVILIMAGGATFASTEVENAVNAQISAFYQDLVAKYEAKEITKEKLTENLRNRIYILKEQYWEQLSEEFYDAYLAKAESLDSLGTTETTVKSEVLSQLDKDTPENNVVTTQATPEKKIKEISEKYKVAIDNAFDMFFAKLDSYPAERRTEILGNINQKVSAKLQVILDTPLTVLPEKTKDQLVMILEYIKSKVEFK